GKQGLEMFPDPLGSITDDAEAHLLFRNDTGLFDLLEGLTELRLVVHLMPTQQMHDAVLIKEGEAHALRIAPLAAPPCPLGPRTASSRTALPGAVGPRRDTGPIDAQHHHRATLVARRYHSDAPRHPRTRRHYLRHRQPFGSLIRHCVHALTAHMHPRQRP